MYLTTIPALREQLILGHQRVAIPFAVVIINDCVIVQSRLNEASAGVIWDCSGCASCSGVVAYNNTSAALDLIAPAGHANNHPPACKRLANKPQPANLFATCVTAYKTNCHRTNAFAAAMLWSCRVWDQNDKPRIHKQKLQAISTA